MNMFTNFFNSIKSSVIAFFIAYFLHPFVKMIDKKLLIKVFKISSKKIRKILSILISYIVFLGIIVLLATYVLPQVFSEPELSHQLLTKPDVLFLFFDKI